MFSSANHFRYTVYNAYILSHLIYILHFQTIFTFHMIPWIEVMQHTLQTYIGSRLECVMVCSMIARLDPTEKLYGKSTLGIYAQTTLHPITRWIIF